MNTTRTSTKSTDLDRVRNPGSGRVTGVTEPAPRSTPVPLEHTRATCARYGPVTAQDPQVWDQALGQPARTIRFRPVHTNLSQDHCVLVPG